MTDRVLPFPPPPPPEPDGPARVAAVIEKLRQKFAALSAVHRLAAMVVAGDVVEGVEYDRLLERILAAEEEYRKAIESKDAAP